MRRDSPTLTHVRSTTISSLLFNKISCLSTMLLFVRFASGRRPSTRGNTDVTGRVTTWVLLGRKGDRISFHGHKSSVLILKAILLTYFHWFFWQTFKVLPSQLLAPIGHCCIDGATRPRRLRTAISNFIVTGELRWNIVVKTVRFAGYMVTCAFQDIWVRTQLRLYLAGLKPSNRIFLATCHNLIAMFSFKYRFVLLDLVFNGAARLRFMSLPRLCT